MGMNEKRAVLMTGHGRPPRCPFAGGEPFEPGSVAAAADPHPWLRAARAEAPVFYDESSEAYFVTRYEDALEVVPRLDIAWDVRDRASIGGRTA
jgi:hypothetical protein